MAVRITSEHTYARNARARIQAHTCNRVVAYRDLFDTQANTRTPFGAPRRVRIAIGIAV